MADSMTKKEKLARGSAVIKVMKVIPRPGNYLKSFVDPRKLPRAPRAGAKGVLADMPWLDVKSANFEFRPKDAKVPGVVRIPGGEDYCDTTGADRDPSTIGLPDGDKMMKWFEYKTWAEQVNPISDGNIAVHFNIMLGLLISMAVDSGNESFADAEAYPSVQFLKTIKTPDGEIPYNVAQFLGYIEFVCQKMCDEG